MKKRISLVILAAGIGSRYGVGIKQLEPVGPDGELIIDYSIHDAIAAGFNKVVFIIRKDIYDDFYEVIGSRLEKEFKRLDVEWEYVYQDRNDLPEGFTCPADRTKPWGTGQALLACRDAIKEPFAVLNADDYYGKEAFVKAFNFLNKNTDPKNYGMVGYILKNTLSDNGSVTRGVCTVEDGVLTRVLETKDIVKTGDVATGQYGELSLDSLVSMNFWMFPPEYIDELKEGFPKFLKGMKNELKDEYLLPIIVDGLLSEGKCKVTVESSNDKWFGVTYHEDKETVMEAFCELYKKGVYGGKLFEDLK